LANGAAGVVGAAGAVGLKSRRGGVYVLPEGVPRSPALGLGRSVTPGGALGCSAGVVTPVDGRAPRPRGEINTLPEESVPVDVRGAGDFMAVSEPGLPVAGPAGAGPVRTLPGAASGAEPVELPPPARLATLAARCSRLKTATAGGGALTWGASPLVAVAVAVAVGKVCR
jgi:hypothetical protein